jgi:hypothetical protein
MQHLALCPSRENHLSAAVRGILAQVRFLAYHRIKPHAPPLVRAPVNSFEFHTCVRTPQVGYLSLSLGHAPHRGAHLVTIVYSVDYQGI